MLLVIVLCALASWFAISVLVGVLVGRSIAVAEQAPRRTTVRAGRIGVAA